MGECIKSIDFNSYFVSKTKVPIIICTQEQKVKIDVGKFKKYKINMDFVTRMLSYDAGIKKLEVTNTMRQLLDLQDKPIVLLDFEALFDPIYDVDVIKLFEDLGKSNRLIIKWCGEYKNDELIFSKPENDDYHKYKIKNYNIFCVV